MKTSLSDSGIEEAEEWTTSGTDIIYQIKEMLRFHVKDFIKH